jgi:hypothetical protein
MSNRRSGRAWTLARPVFPYGPASIFREDATVLARSTSQVLKEKLANQLYYSSAAQTGKFYGYAGMGYGGFGEGFATVVGATSAVTALYVVSPQLPRAKVWLVKEEGGEEELRPSGFSSNLQSFLEEVPMPDPARTLLGALEPIGTDRVIVIWCPGENKMWEMHRLGKKAKSQEGTLAGEWKCGNAAYYPQMTSSNGIPENKWGTSASGLGLLGGQITTRDLVRALRGEALGHALRLAVPVRRNEYVAPAVRNDYGENGFEFQKDGVTPNPAFGAVDAVPEGLWCAFPSASRASEHGITTPLAAAMYEAMREHGVVVTDGAGTCEFYVCDPRALGSAYADTIVNPLAETTNKKLEEYIGHLIPASWRDATLPKFEEELSGTSSVLAGMPWRELEQLEPRSS